MPTPTLILTADPGFADLALAELQQAGPGAQIGAELGAGVWTVTAVSFAALAAAWREAPPIFVRHICPVQALFPLPGTPADVPQLSTAVGEHFSGWLEAQVPFSVQTRILAPLPYKPFAVNTAVAHALQAQTRAPLDIRRPQQILSLVLAAGQAYAGLSIAVDNISDWAGGERRLARTAGQISRAEFKLVEAWEWFRLGGLTGGEALDLGAAPGGWTRILRQKGFRVTAVDPAPLHPDLGADPGVIYRPLTAEAYLAQPPPPFDLLVNDMRQDARDSARLMAAFAPHLRPGGAALMTLKLPRETRPSLMAQTFHILRQAYHVAGARHLFHNRREVTVYLQPRR